MESGFLIAQIIGFFAMCFAITGMQLKNPRNMIKCYIPVGLLWGTQYVILGAHQGAIFSFGAAVKDAFLSHVSDKYVTFVILTFLALLWGISSFFIQYWYDLLPLIAGTIVNLGFLKRDIREVIARTSLTSQFCWFAYNMIVGSWMGMLCAVLVVTSIFIGMVRHESWVIGRCYRTFLPSIARSLFTFPNFRTYP